MENKSKSYLLNQYLYQDARMFFFMENQDLKSSWKRQYGEEETTLKKHMVWLGVKIKQKTQIKVKRKNWLHDQIKKRVKRKKEKNL